MYTSKPKFIFYSGYVSGAIRLPMGNTLVCSGGNIGFSIFFEVTPEKKIVWHYFNKLPFPLFILVMKFEYYPLGYPGIGEFRNID